MAFTPQELEIIKFGQQNGKSRAEVEQAISNFRNGIKPVKVAPVIEEQSLGSKLMERGKTFGKEALTLGTLGASTLTQQDIQEARQSKEQGGLVGLQAINRAAQSPIRMAGAVGGAIGDVFGAGLEAVGADKVIGDTIAPVVNTESVQRLLQNYQTLPPETQQVLGDIMNTLNIPLSGFGVGAVKSGVEKGISTGIETAGKATNLKQTVRDVIAKQTASPQLQSSSKRLFLDGTKNVSDPLSVYENYLLASKNAVEDIKAEPAISIVGEDIGNAYQQVIKQRQAVGKVLGDELKNIGKNKVQIDQTKLFTELKDSGLSFNPRTRQLTSFQGSRFAEPEVRMLQEYVDGILSLGSNPSVAQIDNFIAKTRSQLEFTKGQAGVVGTTNAERIINASVGDLKNTLSQFPEYWKANQAYSELSSFLKEGEGFLGKMTQSGDFAKDASLAKSSVQSILNNGKKDWLMKLEDLTGEPLLDKSVLALQAMKDAGDFRGASLLQKMTEGSVPTSQSGLVDKIIQFGLEKGSQIVAGSPEEQTRAYLQSLGRNIAPISNSAKNTTAKTGATANSINQSNNFIQPNSTPTTPKSKGIRGMVNPSELLPKKKVVSKPIKVYHGTSLENANKIKEEGFKTGVGKGVSGTASNDFIYVTENKNSANKYVSDRLSIKNPTVVESSFSGKVLDIPGKLADFEAFGEASKKLGVPLGKDSQGKLSLLDAKALKDAMQKQGYSAIRFSDKYQNGTKAIAVIPEKLSKVPSKVATSLEQEAKKYKSAEEFVKAQQPTQYRFEDDFGGSVAAKIEGNTAHIFDAFAKEKGHGLYENAINDLAKRGIQTIEVNLQSVDSTNVLKRLVEKGVLKNPRGGDPRLDGRGYKTVFDISNFTTKSQLTDIWNKANKK